MTSSDAWGGLAGGDSDQADALILGIPFDGGVGGRAGASFGPRHLRYLSHRLKTISSRGHDFDGLKLVDLGDVEVPRLHLEAAVDRIFEHYRPIFRSAAVPVTIGGDHSITFPLVRAAAGAGGRWGVVWIDAHPDLLDSYLGSRVSHGSPLRRILSSAGVDARDVLLVGTRAYDHEERALIQDAAIEEVPAFDFCADHAGAVERVRRAACAIARRVDHLYVSIDIDVLDPAYAPGTGTPVGGGLSTAQLVHVLDVLPTLVRGYDVVEYSPPLDVVDVTGQAVLVLITEILSRIARAKRG